ncbi:GDSL esterase/lipase [Quillaja saponaria]|uniref:GDSL esterase/lipase n=1 Tax=Quillaja saponaria TaxID=32244 RepID=A0AAD7PWM0_QUISA|nr:GDSL esterase/lipase [Quillaja saponaria]
MEKLTLPFLFSLLFLLVLPSSFAGVQSIKELYGFYNGSAKLFVFGDSYADPGNTPVSLSPSWKLPYGETFPGKPAGRFSDGRVLTDYIVAGNDYSTFNARIGNQTEKPAFTKSLINQISFNLKRIHDLGVKKIAVIGLQPLGCLPAQTFGSSFQQCDEAQNMVSNFHNQLLIQEVQKLNHEKKKSVFFILDLYSAFISAINEQKNHAGQLKSMNPLEPCCVGTSEGFSCGRVNEKGEKKYSVCKNPEESIFWDLVHPSQNGWHSVYLNLQSSLHQLY